MHERRAFTLIEVLVVMAIISLLMGMLLPALTKAKEQTRAAICMSNMRQIGFGADFYAQDWRSRIPRETDGPIQFQVFMPYLAQRPMGDDYRNVRIYRCPSYPNKRQTVCYVVNGWEFRSDNDMVGYETEEATQLKSVRRRAYTIYLADNEDGGWRKIITAAEDMTVDMWRFHMPR